MVVLLIIGAGVALVLQNLVMTRVAAQASTMLIALWLNSAVGLVILSAAITWRHGVAGLSEGFSSLRGLGLLPGFLGTFIVFSLLMGYRSMNAAAVVVILVASQLIAGLAADAWRGTLQGPLWQPLLGAALLMAGAALVSWR